MTIDDFKVEEYCEQAVSMCKKLADVELDYTLESLEKLEGVIGQTRALRRKDRGLIDDNVAWNLSVYFGTYFGEIMLRDQLAARGMSWQLNENGLPVVMDEKHRNALSPISKIYKKLTEGENEVDEEGDLPTVYKIYLWMLERDKAAPGSGSEV